MKWLHYSTHCAKEFNNSIVGGISLPICVAAKCKMYNHVLSLYCVILLWLWLIKNAFRVLTNNTHLDYFNILVAVHVQL